MRYWIGFVLALTLVASPLSVSAQSGQEATAVTLEVDEVGVGVVPSPPRTVDGYTLEEMELRARRAKIGLGVSAGLSIAGAAMFGAGITSWDLCIFPPPEGCDDDAGLMIAGMVVMTGGLVGLIASGAMLGKRKRKLRELRVAHYRAPHRVQWDLAQSRLVF